MVKRNGSDIIIVAISYMVYKSLRVADKLSDEGISIEVVDLRTMKPLDIGTIADLVKKTGMAVLFVEVCFTGRFTYYLLYR